MSTNLSLLKPFLLKPSLLKTRSINVFFVYQNTNRLALLSMAMLLMLASLIQPAHADTKTLYEDTCATCHETGALNAPKKGDKARWQQLKSKKGMPALVQSVKAGMTQMPAGGLCNSCNDEQYRQLIDYMSN